MALITRAAYLVVETEDGPHPYGFILGVDGRQSPPFFTKVGGHAMVATAREIKAVDHTEALALKEMVDRSTLPEGSLKKENALQTRYKLSQIIDYFYEQMLENKRAAAEEEEDESQSTQIPVSVHRVH